MRTFAQKKATQQNTSAKFTMPGRARFGQSREVDSILHLQRMIGNQAVQQLLQAQPDGLDAFAAGRCGHDFSGIPVHAKAAERPASARDAVTLHQELATEQGQPDVVPAIVREVLRSPGEPIERHTRSAMEARFGHDFSRVRVHTGGRAAQSAGAVKARAYTVGQDIVFAAGQYAPQTDRGRGLLAHELTHTLQQPTVISASEPGNPIIVAPPGTVLERDAKQNAVGLGSDTEALQQTGKMALQRSPDDEEIQSYVFAGDKKLATDQEFARQSGRNVSAKMLTMGTISRDVELEVHGMLAFFKGEAKDVYLREIQPAVKQLENAGKTLAEGFDPTASFETIKAHAKYIDNNIKQISYYTAELAEIYYKDGATLSLGLVKQWMKPPFKEVDYHTPAGDYRPIFSPQGAGFFRESEMAAIPRTMSLPEMRQKYSHPFKFDIEPDSGRIVPTRVNMLTAPTLCRVLLESEKQFVEQSNFGAQMGKEVAGVMTYWAGASGFSKGPGVEIKRRTSKTAAQLVTSPEAKKLAAEMDNLLTAGGSKTLTVQGVEFAQVEVTRRGNTIAVSRYSSELPAALRGNGTGSAMNAAFEEAAVAMGRMNGAKTVTIDVGKITNPGWRELLEARGYVKTRIDTPGGGFIFNWIKTIVL